MDALTGHKGVDVVIWHVGIWHVGPQSSDGIGW
jgi:hypothetical protein